MKKALVVSATAGFIKGFLINDMKLLQNMGYEVHCAANADSVTTFAADQFFPEIGILFHQIDFSSTSPISKKSIDAYKQIRKLVKEFQFDVIHCHTPIAGAIVRIAAAKYRRKGCKIIYTTHGLTFPKGSSLKSRMIYGSVEWICSWISDGIITINKEDFGQMKKMKCKNVFYINGVGVDTQKFHNVAIDREEYREKIGVKKEDIMILSVGELSPRKNHQIVIKSLAELKDGRYVFVICGKVMVGAGTYEYLKKLSEEFNVRVIFLGFRSDIPEICHCADIAVLPSLREGLGLAGIEALASGVPVIGTDIQGIKDYVVDGKTGYLCPAMDEKVIADKITLLSDAKIREDMRENCIKKAEEFSTSVSFGQMEQIYKKLLNV
ncbi:MAG: glycosyltransferase family 4 protein [Eubacterium sp.]